MKSDLRRIVAGAVRNGRPRTILGSWGGWPTGFRPRRDERFQSLDEPYPRHWRAGRPRRLGPLDPAWIRRTIEALPRTWRSVLRGHETGRLHDDPVVDRLGLSAAQQRRILHRARTAIRDAAADSDRERP